MATTAQSSVHPTSPASSWWFVSVPILAAPFLEKRAVGATSGLRALLSARDTTRGPQREDRGGHHVPRSSLGLTCPCSRTRRRGSKRLCGNPPQKKAKRKKKKLQKAAETKQEERAETAALPLQNPAAAPALGQQDREGKNPVPCSGMGGRSRWGLLGSPGFSSRLGVSPACPWGSHLIAVTQLSICTSPR